MAQARILVVGGGIAGLTAALALARHGFSVSVLERAAQFREVGAGLQLGANAMRVMAALGLAPDVASRGFRPDAAEIRLGDLGHQVFCLRFAQNAALRTAYVQIHRADLLDLLVAAVRDAGVALHPAVRIVKIVENTDSVAGVTEDGQRFEADILIGADGLRSAVQGYVLAPQPPRFTGQVAWRATVAADAVPAGLVAPRGTIWVGPGRHLVTYFLRGGQLINIVAVEERDDWREEGWMLPGDPALLRAAFADWHPRVTTLLSKVSETYLWALYDRAPLPVWTKGRVALIGDACHPMLPFLAQGAAMAIEDGWVLADCLARDTGTAGLARYASLRQGRTARVQGAARRNAGRFHRRGPVGRTLEFGPMALANLFAPWVLRRSMRWLYDHDVTGGSGV
ncbi:MAG: FAD-dependent oxidoreductase [Pseudomonadota bacterium]